MLHQPSQYACGLMLRGHHRTVTSMTTTVPPQAGALLHLTTYFLGTVIANLLWHSLAPSLSGIPVLTQQKKQRLLKNLFDELGIQNPRTVPLMCDNQSTIKQSLNQVDQRRCRHLGMRSHFLRQQCHVGNLQLQFVPSSDQLGDLYTKCLPKPQHEKLRKISNVMSTAQFHAKFGSAKLTTQSDSFSQTHTRS